MDIHFLVAFLFVPGILAQTQAKGQCPPLTYFYYSFDWVLEDRVLKTHTVPNEEFCYAHCISDQRCRSLNYQTKTGIAVKAEHQCVINYSTKNRHPGSMKPRLGWVYEEVEGADSLPALDSVTVTVKPPIVWVEEGQTETLVCSATGQPAPTITWSKVDGGLGTNHQIDGNLTLPRVKLETEGTYRCEAKNDVNTKSALAKIKVVPLAQFTVAPPKLVTVTSESHIQLNCKATFHSTITWQRQGGTLPKGHKIHPNGTLVLLNLSDESAGVYVCKASTHFRSVNTTTQVKFTYRSCSHLKAAFPSKVSGNYDIDPDGEGGENPFIAYCDMKNKNGIGVTVISHDKENRERVTDCDLPGCLEKNVTYTSVTIAQLAILTRAASHCEQFVMFECKNEIQFIAEKAAWWLSRDRKPMYYWGGAIPYSKTCACGMTNTCVGGGRCNCKNYGPGGWRNDSGLLTDRSSLPVVQLTIKNVGNSWERDGRYTLGKFKCYGIISITESVTVSAPVSLTSIFLENVTLSCKVIGHPKPLITWRRKDEQTMDGKWTFLGGNLTLIEVSFDEQGIYICEGKNGVNTATTETNLVVIKFTVTPPVLVTAPERAWIQLDCQTNINSTVTWRRRGRHLPMEHLSFPNGTLLLRMAASSFSGFYACAVKFHATEVLKETQVLIGNLSCSHVKAGYPKAPSGNYTIDPDSEGGEDPFVVYCDMSDKNRIGVTVVGHDRKERSHVRNCNTSGCYSPNVTYFGTTIPQLANLAKVSTHCEQFIILECNGSVAFIGEKASWWISRDGKPMLYWGGAAAGNKKCACGMTSTCDGGGVCNCKTYGPRGWRNDSGLLTDRSSLPVTQLTFGSMSGESYYTLKTFKCYGSITVTENQSPVLKTPLKHVAVLYELVTIPLQTSDPEGTPVTITCKSCPAGTQVTHEKKLKYRAMTVGVRRFELVLKDKSGGSTTATLALDVCACQNGGSCILKGSDSYTCSCHRCYTGKHCERELTARDDPECDPNTCSGQLRSKNYGGCCSVWKKCKRGYGGCSKSSDCDDGLECETGNCPSNPGFRPNIGCCMNRRTQERRDCSGKIPTRYYFVCCSSSNKCLEGHGDCDSDSDCQGDLKCGRDNCPINNTGFIHSDDCCQVGEMQEERVVCDGKKRGVDYGYCCSPFNKCPIDHGDCDSDADCLSGLKCGIDNCRMEWGFIWNSDCCYRE